MNLRKILKVIIFLTLLESCFKIYVPKGWKNNNPLIPEEWLTRI